MRYIRRGMENTGRDYVTLDDLTERETAKNDPKMFLQIHKPPVFIDEVQYAQTNGDKAQAVPHGNQKDCNAAEAAYPRVQSH